MVRALEESEAWCVDSEWKEGCRRTVAGLALGGEQTVRWAASLGFWKTRRVTLSRQDSIVRMPIGVEEKQFVAHRCPLCQNMLSLDRESVLGEKRSAPERRIGAMRNVASLWHT